MLEIKCIFDDFESNACKPNMFNILNKSQYKLTAPYNCYDLSVTWLAILEPISLVFILSLVGFRRFYKL